MRGFTVQPQRGKHNFEVIFIWFHLYTTNLCINQSNVESQNLRTGKVTNQWKNRFQSETSGINKIWQKNRQFSPQLTSNTIYNPAMVTKTSACARDTGINQ